MRLAIGFSTSSSWYSGVIRWFTKSDISHAYVVVRDDTFDDDLVMEAIATGFSLVPWTVFRSGVDKVRLYKPKYPLGVGVKRLASDVGESYGWFQVLGLAVSRLGRYFRRNLKNPFFSNSSLFCSEAVADMIRDSGWPGSDKLLPGVTSPADLESYLKSIGSELTDTP